MIDIKLIRQDPELVHRSLRKRGQDYDLRPFLECDSRRRAILLEVEELKHERNRVSGRIAQMNKERKDPSGLITRMRTVSQRIKALDEELSKYEKALHTILMDLPNLPHHSVPIGRDSEDNVVIKKVGEPRSFGFEPLPHWDIGKELGILDFERAAKITGARFVLYTGLGARLERALINFMLDVHTREHGYIEVLPPFMTNRTSMTATGQLPKFEEDLFKLEGWDYYLVPTAEVPLTNIHQGEILDEQDLPRLYAAYTPCFRSEAGSYGKDTRGLIRQHQFNKVELVRFTTPERSYGELEELLNDAEIILKRLEIPYQVIVLCTGDLGFSAAKTYDIEAWVPAQQKYREVSSCSNFEDFQARRGSIRFRRKGKKGTELVHTLNGSGLAVGRIVAAIMENYQQEDGTVIIPESIRPYMDGVERIGA
ncbi:MAG: serine--tRNA ligase [Desulfobacterales bacterium C00003060]|nr:MAG: serine--tRNA ligase [Desulfobacterales bacterium C00003060]